jgi:hypothetical protein
MFGTDTQEKMPDAFLTDHTAWDEFMGHIWHGILSSLDFKKESCVIDIAPGSSIKLGAALAQSGYCGNLYVVDASAEALDALKKKYAVLLPHAQIHWLCGPLKEQVVNLPQQPDYILANHIIDDMILAACGTPHEHQKNFSWASAYEHAPVPAFEKSWRRILADPALLSSSQKIVEEELTGVIRSLNPRCVILNQYPSSTLYDHGLGAVNDHAFSVFMALQKAFGEGLADPQPLQAILDTVLNYGNLHIGEHILNAKYWMLLRPKK